MKEALGNTSDTGEGADGEAVSSELSRRILKKLSANFSSNRQVLVCDGCQLAYAPKRLFTEGEKVKLEDQKVGIYGPADESAPQLDPSALFQSFDVKVKKDVDEDHPEAELAKFITFKVLLTEVAVLPFKQVFSSTQLKEISLVQQVRHADQASV
eukprot:CAMPEP_0118723750 /NCGR_PEP_ID=MMETSP0800-20121206/32176_1 /TAXON_ID=210618 ORGANISM="Striatella unipunctata, Strain CCMP2910" /NCGR_SAMPLE_ID=MMETSP0800 /ASSEMBLY_ACC=CAM_ASM_000638 /LENGTH=154 /DNA_ID=CAMNT_0006632209 /DNA_START=87 /DNA_END=551 /DNA_ORIENTATION=+